MGELIDVTMTATVRPLVILRALESFQNKVASLNPDCSFRLVANIDDIGDIENHTRADVVYKMQWFFKNQLLRLPEKFGFPSALKWCFENVESEFFFNIEDDWKFLKPIDLEKIFHFMHKNHDLAILRLPYRRADENQAKQWNKFFPWNGEFFECPEELRPGLGFSGHPSLIRTAFIREIVKHLTEDSCPEKQIKGHNPVMRNILKRWRFGVFQKQSEGPYVEDIGREWRDKMNLKKNGSYGFSTWEPK